MDIPPGPNSLEFTDWEFGKEKVEAALADAGLQYLRGGRVLPVGEIAERFHTDSQSTRAVQKIVPTSIEELLEVLIKGLKRAMHPLSYRRKGAQPLAFSSEYDVQDLLHALLRPWVADIRPEEYTPSYAGSSTRMDFLLPKYQLVLEIKFVRDKAHGRKIGEELIVDIEHYRRHKDSENLWCVIFDPDHLLLNPEGLKTDLEGTRSSKDGAIDVRVFVL